MSAANETLSALIAADGERYGCGERYSEDVAALLHFSSYIAKEAKRLGIPRAAEKAELMEIDLLAALENG